MLQVLQAPDEPMSIVIGSFQDVKRTSSECKERARALYDALAKWSTAVEEFWEHFTPEAAVVEQRQKAAEQKLSFGGKVPKGQVERPGEVQKSVKHMEESTMVPSIFQDPDAESRGSSKLTGDDAEQYVRAATSKLATTQEQCKSASEQLAALEAPEKTYLAGLTSARNELAQFQVQRVNPVGRTLHMAKRSLIWDIAGQSLQGSYPMPRFRCRVQAQGCAHGRAVLKRLHRRWWSH